MPTGRVKWFSDDKGFGFITPDEPGKDLFVHHTAIRADGYRSLAEGTRVTYAVEAGDKGPKAVDVSIASDEHEGLVEEIANFLIPCIVDPDGSPLLSTSPLYAEILTDVRSVSSQLVDRLVSEPDKLQSLTPSEFRELVAELLSRRGYEVSAAPGADGFDFAAARKDSVGSIIFLVDCAALAPPHRVGVSLVERLHATVDRTRANAGLIATTSTFTHDAQRFASGEFKWRMHLKDFVDIKQWLLEEGHRARRAA